MYKLEEALKIFAVKNGDLQNMADKETASESARFDLLVELRKRFIKATIAKYW